MPSQGRFRPQDRQGAGKLAVYEHLVETGPHPGLAPTPHDHTHHTDIPRTDVIWASDMTGQDGATPAVIGTGTELWDVWRLATNLLQGVRFGWRVPDGWTSGTIGVSALWVPTVTDADATHTVRWGRRILWVSNGTDLATAATATNATGTAIARTANVAILEAMPFTMAPSPPAAGTFLRATFYRHGQNAADTYDAGAVDLVALVLSFTARE